MSAVKLSARIDIIRTANGLTSPSCAVAAVLVCVVFVAQVHCITTVP